MIPYLRVFFGSLAGCAAGILVLSDYYRSFSYSAVNAVMTSAVLTAGYWVGRRSK